MSDGNASILLDEIATLDSEIEDLDDQLSGLTSNCPKEIQVANLENTISCPRLHYVATDPNNRFQNGKLPSSQPGYFMDIGFDDGEGLGIDGDGKVTYEEVQTTVGECREISA